MTRSETASEISPSPETSKRPSGARFCCVPRRAFRRACAASPCGSRGLVKASRGPNIAISNSRCNNSPLNEIQRSSQPTSWIRPVAVPHTRKQAQQCRALKMNAAGGFRLKLAGAARQQHKLKLRQRPPARPIELIQHRVPARRITIARMNPSRVPVPSHTSPRSSSLR